MQRRAFNLGLTATALALLTGCGRGSDQLRITYYGASNQNAAMSKALDAVQAADPDLTAAREPGSFTGYYDKLATQLGAGSAPDILMNDFTHLAGYAQRGALLDLSGSVPDPIDPALARPSTFDGGRYGDRLFGVPIGTHTQAILANDKLLPAGRTADLESMTWERFAELCTEIGAAGGNKVFGTEDGGAKDFALDIWVRQRGGQLFSEDHSLGFERDDLVDWFDYWDRLRKTRGAVPIDITVDPTVIPVVTGVAAFGFSFSSYSGTQEQTDAPLTVLPLPAASATDRPGAYQYIKPTNVYCVNADTDQPEPSIKIISKFITEPSVGLALGTTLGSPPSRQVFDTLHRRATGVDKAILDFDATIQHHATASDYPPPRPTGADQLLTSTGSLLTRLNESIAYGVLSPSEGADEFFSQSKSYLQP